MPHSQLKGSIMKTNKELIEGLNLKELLGESNLTRYRNVKKLEKEITYECKPAKIYVNIRYNDNCNNGHNSFAITGDIYSSLTSKADRYFETGGCIHEQITKYFPELKKYIKWHLVSSDSPMYYLENTLYHAKDREDMTKEVGEPTRFKEVLRFKGYPFTFEEKEKGFFNWIKNKKDGFDDVKVLSVSHPKDSTIFSTNYTFTTFEHEKPSPSGAWYDALFQSKTKAEEFLTALQMLEPEFIQIPTAWNEAKEPDLKGARSCAIWEDATLEQLQDKEQLLKRLPALMQEFKNDMLELGFEW